MGNDMGAHTKINIVDLGDWRLLYINGICYDRKMNCYELLKKIEEIGKPIFFEEDIIKITHEMLSKNNKFVLEIESKYKYSETQYRRSLYKNIKEFLKYHYNRESKEYAKMSKALRSVSKAIE